MVLNGEQLKPPPPRPKLCHLSIRDAMEGYGFNLHAERARPGQYIGKVDPGSPADDAGLREGDRIIEVNGVNISQENHKQVVSRIKSIPRETKLLVVDKITDDYYKEIGEIIKDNNAIEYYSYNHEQDNYSVKSDNSEDQKDIEAHIVKTEATIETPPSSSNTLTTTEDEANRLATEMHNNSLNDDEKNTLDKGSVTSHDDEDCSSGHSSSYEDRAPSSTRSSVERVPLEISSRGSSVVGSSSSDGYSGSSSRSTPSPTNRSDLDLNMTAAEMRQKISERKKRDPRKDNRLDFVKKFEYIQNL